MRSPNVFHDPNGVLADYAWAINHSEESSNAKKQNINVSAPANGLGLLPVQAASSPLIHSWSGTILTRAQLLTMMQWFKLCLGDRTTTPVTPPQTIYLTDFAGNEAEGLIVMFDPTRVGVARNPRDPNNRTNIWKYKLDFHVVRIISGDWAGITP